MFEKLLINTKILEKLNITYIFLLTFNPFHFVNIFYFASSVFTNASIVSKLVYVPKHQNFIGTNYFLRRI